MVRLLKVGKGSAQLIDFLDKLSSSLSSVLYATSHVIKQNFSSSSAICFSDKLSEEIYLY